MCVTGAGICGLVDRLSSCQEDLPGNLDRCRALDVELMRLGNSGSVRVDGPHLLLFTYPSTRIGKPELRVSSAYS